MRGNQSLGFPTRFDIKQSVGSQKEARSLKFRIWEEEDLHSPCSENEGAEQLCSYCAFVFV